MLTTLPGIREEQLAQAGKAQAQRMASLGGQIVREVRVPHDVASVAGALSDLLAGEGGGESEDGSGRSSAGGSSSASGIDIVLVLGASAIVDRDDVLPAAIRAIGGEVDHLGMPVDPGNLLLLGHKGRVPVVGVPGCARSLRPSGFDWVLERLAANVPVTREDIMRMGAGELLADVPSRPAPRRIEGVWQR